MPDDPIERAMKAAQNPTAAPVYDILKIKALLNTSRAYAMHPAGEMITDLATQLRLAVEEIGIRDGKVHRAETDLAILRGQVERDQQTYAVIREELEKFRAATPVPPRKPGRPKLKLVDPGKAGAA
jgi:hypothetical protein